MVVCKPLNQSALLLGSAARIAVSSAISACTQAKTGSSAWGQDALVCKHMNESALLLGSAARIAVSSAISACT
jgi:hypothetical protein